MFFWRKRKPEPQVKNTDTFQVKRVEQTPVKKLSIKTVQILASFDLPLVVVTEKEEIGERLAQRRIKLLIDELALKPTEIIVFFNSFYKDKFWKEATSFWRVCGSLCNNNLSQINDLNQRKRIFDLANFEKYKAFIILTPLERGNISNEFIERIRRTHKNILWLANQAIFSQKQFELIDGLFSFYVKGKARELKEGTLIHVDTYKNKEEELVSQPKSLSELETKKVILNQVENSYDNYSIQLSNEVKEAVLEDNCLLFSENQDILKKITQERIDIFSKDSKKIGIVSYYKDWESTPSIIFLEPWLLTTDYLLSSQNDFKSIVFYYNNNENIRNCIVKCLQLSIKVFVAFKEKNKDVLNIFKENSHRFIFLDFDSNFTGDAKIFAAPLLSINSTSSEVGELQFDSKATSYVLESYCLFFSRDLKILERAALTKIDHLNQLAKEKLKKLNALIISSFFNSKDSSVLDRQENLSIVKHDLKSFARSYIFKDSKPSPRWEEELEQQLKKFDVVIVFKETNSILERVISIALNTCSEVFVLCQGKPEVVLDVFKKSSQKFVFLDFDAGPLGKCATFERSILSISTEISETKELKLDLKTKKHILESNCLLFSENWNILKVLTQERIDNFSKNQKVRIISSLSGWKQSSNSHLVRPEDLLTNYLLKQDTNFNSAVICTHINESLLDLIIQYLRLNIKVFIALQKKSDEILTIFKENCRKFVYLNFGSEFSAEVEIFPKRLSPEAQILTVNELNSSQENYVDTEVDFHPKEEISQDENISYDRYEAKQDKEGIYVGEFIQDNLIADVNDSLLEKKDPLFGEINNEISNETFEIKQNFEDVSNTTKNQSEELVDVFDIQKEEFSEKSLKVIEDFSKPLAILTENEVVSKKLALERISLMLNKYGLSSEQIMIAFSSSYKDDTSIKVNSFWKVCENLCNYDLHQIYHEYQRKRIFDRASFESKYRAFIIVSSFDCNVVLKELVNRIKDISNVLWLACYPDLSEEHFSLINDLLPTYSRFKAIGSEDGQTINIDSFSKKKSEIKSAFLLQESQEEDSLFEDIAQDSDSEIDPLFDETIEVKAQDPSDFDDDIDNGLF